MARIPFILGLLAVAVLLTTCDAEAAGRRGWRSRSAHRAAAHPLHLSAPPTARGSTSPADLYYRSLYPKYQTGFHARETQNLGIPTGDIGLRGNGMFWTPW